MLLIPLNLMYFSIQGTVWRLVHLLMSREITRGEMERKRKEGRKEEIMETDRVVRPDAKRRHMEEEGDWSLEAGEAWSQCN